MSRLLNELSYVWFKDSYIVLLVVYLWDWVPVDAAAAVRGGAQHPPSLPQIRVSRVLNNSRSVKPLSCAVIIFRCGMWALNNKLWAL